MTKRLAIFFVVMGCASWAMAQGSRSTAVPPPPQRQTATPTGPGSDRIARVTQHYHDTPDHDRAADADHHQGCRSRGAERNSSGRNADAGNTRKSPARESVHTDGSVPDDNNNNRQRIAGHGEFRECGGGQLVESGCDESRSNESRNIESGFEQSGRNRFITRRQDQPDRGKRNGFGQRARGISGHRHSVPTCSRAGGKYATLPVNLLRYPPWRAGSTGPASFLSGRKYRAGISAKIK